MSTMAAGSRTAWTEVSYRSEWRMYTAWCERTGREVYDHGSFAAYITWLETEWVPELVRWKYEAGLIPAQGKSAGAVSKAVSAIRAGFATAGYEPPPRRADARTVRKNAAGRTVAGG